MIHLETNNELLSEFVLEAEAHIAAVEAGLLQMENDECDDDTINRREGNVSTSQEMIDTLLSATDKLKELVGHLTESEEYAINSHVAAVKAFLPQEKIVKKPEISAWDLWDQLTTAEETQRTDLKDLAAGISIDPSAWELPEDLTVNQVSQNSKPKKDSLVTKAEGLVKAFIAPEVQEVTNPSETKRKHGVTGDSVRVSVELLNDLLNIVGEMVLRRNQLLNVSQNAGKEVPYLDVIAQGMDDLTTSLQEKVMKTRMQPIANIFNKFPRIVRELSRKLQKEVELVMEGLNVELDRSIIESLVDPITHLVRNALDHGIEDTEVRIERNKPIEGTIKLYAYHESGRVIIDICDDGAGINVEKVKAKAVAKGWISEKEATVMRELDALNFIMRPGFSTAEQVTDISGRGVGMDVVKTNIEKLGGKIEIHTEEGTGTIFRLILPLTLAIISAFIVETDGCVFAVPQVNVKELVLIQPEEKPGKRIEFIHSKPLLRLRNQLIPIYRLEDLLDTTTEASGCSKDNYEYFADKEKIFRIIVIKRGNLRYGLAVDAVYDTEEILVKPVPASLKTGGCYSGVTVLGDGRIAMIIDPESLRAITNLCSIEETNANSLVMDDPVQMKIGEEQYLLLFKCSGGEMLGLDLAMVSRIEQVQVSQIQKIGAKHYLAFRGQTIRVIRPEHYLPIGLKKKQDVAKVFVIMPKLVKYPIGIIAEEIHDAVLTNIQLDASGVSGRGIVGSTLVGDTIVTLLNMYELFEEAVPEYYSRINDAYGRAVKPQLAEAENEGKKTIVLLVEDTPFFLKLTKSYLESDGYQVLTAEDGRAALDILLQKKVDVVISDIEMPIMNGIELVRAIRANEELRHLPVIALTSLTADADKEKGLRAGFDIYEFKLDRGRLLESIAQVL
ncbi:MAG: CheA signal transduction histidine kinase [Sporomusa sp.]|nr:CheA signal transduction histidine kinase [Sporomusa sp.]